MQNSETTSQGMFGIYRWVLASMVVAAHLAPKEIIHMGYYSVFGFFVLSGYLMTLVLQERYFKIDKGITKYYINRFLRIYPTYFIVAVFSLILAICFPDITTLIHERFALPKNFYEAINNTIIIGITNIFGHRSSTILIPPAWSLGIEIFFWILFPFLLKTKYRLIVWTLFSIFILTIFIIDNANLFYRYFSPLGSSIAFCSGVWIYHLKKRQSNLNKIIGYLSIILLFAVCFFAHIIFDDPLFEGFYIAFILNCIVIYALSCINNYAIPAQLKKIDKFVGNLSYPIFLIHVPSGLILYIITGDAYPIRSYQFFTLSLLISNILAIIIVLCYDNKIQTIRQKFKI